MDFLTAAPYALILVLIVANALIVRRMKIVIRTEEGRRPEGREDAAGR